MGGNDLSYSSIVFALWSEDLFLPEAFIARLDCISPTRMNSQIDINRVSIKQTTYFCDNFVFTFILIILVICSCIDVDRLWISNIGINSLWKHILVKTNFEYYITMVQDKRNLLHALVWALIKMLNYKVINIMFN